MGEITDLFKQWNVGARIQPDGSSISSFPEGRQSLEDAGFIIEELSRDQLLEVCTGLADMIARGRITSDHERFWAWITHLYAGPRSTRPAPDDPQLHELFRQCCRAALIDPPARPHDSHADHLLADAGMLMTYLALPLLEGLLRRANHEYVTTDGTVIKDFKVPSRKDEYKVSLGKNRPTRCSSVEDMLWLFKQTVDEPFASAIESVGLSASRFVSNDPVGHDKQFRVIYEWRNDALHGGNFWFIAIGALVFSACIVVALHEFKTDSEFELRLNDLFEREGFGGQVIIGWQVRLF